MKKAYHKHKKTSYKMIIVGIIILILVFIIDSQLRPIITNMCNYYIDQFTTTKMSEAISESINETNANYNDYVNLQTDNNGKVLAINTNARQITNVHTNIINKINNALSQFTSQRINVPIGSLSGILWLSGIGPNISIKVQPKGKAKSEIVSKFQEAGINQTLHQIRIEITTDVTGFIPGYTTSTQSKCDCLLAESVIVGSVPNYYTKVISNDSNSDTLSNVYRYGNPKNISNPELKESAESK